MNQYMIDIHLPESFSDEFIALIPSQRMVINEMMVQGVITNYALSLDRKKLWVIMNAENEADAEISLCKFPLISYMRYTIHELMFHNSAQVVIPRFSLN
ncbi:MAG: hypothetical protein EAZ55_07095 [Cytophagales bacterium]|nr:MAG: hypothetical protein EAZ55_07095 [Cytophagales bacterium]